MHRQTYKYLYRRGPGVAPLSPARRLHSRPISETGSGTCDESIEKNAQSKFRVSVLRVYDVNMITRMQEKE